MLQDLLMNAAMGGNVAISNTKIIVGDIGTIATSENLADWTERSSGYGGNIQAIAKGNGICIAGGNVGQVLISADDGETWTTHSTILDDIISTIVFGNGYFMAGTYNNGKIYRSIDGITWEMVKNTGVNYRIFDSAYFSGAFYFVSISGYLAKTSDNGATWESSSGNFFGDHAYVVKALNERLYIGTDGGRIFESLNGTSWSQLYQFGYSYPIRGIAYGNGKFVVCAGYRVYQGAALTSMEHVTTMVNYIYKVHYVNDRFVIIGGNGMFQYATDPTVWNSYNTGFGTKVIRDIAF